MRFSYLLVSFSSRESTLDGFRKFSKFEEIGFTKDIGLSGNNSHHLDFSAFQDFMKEHFCLKVFPILFNIEWISSSDLIEIYF